MKIQNDIYVFSGGLPVQEVIQHYDCPLYVYEYDIIKEQYERLTSAFSGVDLQLNYACKALTNINILKIMKDLGAGLDAVSIQEVMLGIEAGYEPQQILYTPNCVSLAEMIEAHQLGVKINIDNLSMLEQFGQQFPDQPICVRINPHILAGGNSKIMTGHIDSKFGISFHQLPHVQRIVDATGMRIEGVHMHTGSGILDAEVFLQGAEILFSVAEHFPDLDYIDFGSGFKVPYRINDVETDIEDLGAKISKRFIEFTNTYGKNLKLKFEPGKYLVSEAGSFFSRVNVIKQTTSTVFAGVDSGLNHLIRPMFYDAYHEIVNVSRVHGKTRIYTVVGYICETDTFGINRKITEIQEGDVLAFKNAGAYCYQMSSNYNSRFRPAEVLIYDGNHYLIRERETFEDLLNNQIEVDFSKKLDFSRATIPN